MENDNKPKAIYEPGELDKTRKNIGHIDKEEALRMMKTLGGEIGVEKSVSFDKSKMPKKQYAISRTKSSSSYNPTTQIKEPKKTQKQSSTSSSNFALPELDPKVKSYMNEILINYNIKQKDNLFTAFINWALNRHEIVSYEFVVGPLYQYVNNLVRFINSVKKLINSAPDTVQKGIFSGKNVTCKFFNKVYNYNTELLLKLYSQAKRHANDTSIKSLATLTSAMYQFLYAIYFLGEEKINIFINRLFLEIKQKSISQLEPLQAIVRESSSLCLYLFAEVYKGMYPLLMRLTCKSVSMYPIFYTQESSNILRFLGFTKFDILLPEKEPQEKPEQKEETKAASEISEKEIAEQKSRQELLKKGLSVLNTMFPEAGWDNLQNFPDMYPYFNPLFNFSEPFAYLSRENPMQVTVVLIRILDDFFTGCRYITFSLNETFDENMDTAKLQKAIDGWGQYYTVVFERNYLTGLKEIVNNVDAKVDYTETQFGGKTLSNLFWYAKNQFLPQLKFELKYLDVPKTDHMLEPIFKQVPVLRKTFEEIIARAEKAISDNPETANSDEEIGAIKLWDKYHFPMPSPISKRLDVLLGGKKSVHTNNLNLLKYTACVLSVLDWWINDASSPAYAGYTSCPFRKDDDGHPIFFVQERSNVDALFISHLKKK